MKKPVLILTRPAASAQAFAQSLDPTLLARFDLVISPLLRISPIEAPVDLTGVAGVVFSSANGVAFGPDPLDIPAYCVGSATAGAAIARGWNAEMVGQDADALVAQLTATRPAAPLLHIAGKHQRGDIAERLSHAGLQAQTRTVYDQTLCPLTAQARAALASGVPCIIPLFSPRTAAHFAAQAAGARNVTVIALSRAVASCVAELIVERIIIAPDPTAASVRWALENTLDWDRLA